MARDIYEDHDEVSEGPGEMLSTGLVVVTTLLLLVAIFFVQKALGDQYDAGAFAKKEQPREAPVEPQPPAE